MNVDSWGQNNSGLLVPPGHQGGEAAAPGIERQRVPSNHVSSRIVQQGGASNTPIAGWGREDWVWEFVQKLPCGSQMRFYRNGNFERLERNGKPSQDGSDGYIEFYVEPAVWSQFKDFMHYQRSEKGRGVGSMTSFSDDPKARMEFMLPEVLIRMWAAERGIAWDRVDVNEDEEMRADLFAFWRKRSPQSENVLTTGKAQDDG